MGYPESFIRFSPPATAGSFFDDARPYASSRPVTVLKPLSGMQAALLESLRSFCEWDFYGEVQYLFGVRDL